MEITIPIKLAIATEIIDEMKRLGHTHAAMHVIGYRKRQVIKLTEEMDKTPELTEEATHDL
jgi:hypothetical protein